MMKKRIGILAETLQSLTPRGACRVARAFAEQLADSDEFDFVCLQNRLPNQVEITYEAYPLKDWLAQNPIYVPSVTPEPLRAAKDILKPVVKQVTPPLLLDLLKRLRAAIAKQQAKSKIQSLTPTASTIASPIISSTLVTLSDLDALLNFWWFSSDENTYILPIERYDTKIFGWFLDAIPLRVSSDIYTVGVSLEALMNLISAIVAKSDKIICISANSERDLHAFFPQAIGKTHVIPCGHYPQRFQLAGDSQTAETTLEKFNIDPNIPYFVCVGLYESSKNIINIFRACKYLRATQPNLDFQLVLVGQRSRDRALKWFLHQTQKTVRVICTDYASDPEVAALVSKAEALLYPSLWEGFGMPTLEAMSAGTLVITSDLSSLPEVCGEHAIYCDPYDPESIAAAMQFCLEMPPQEREKKVSKARYYASKFTWSSATKQLLEFLRVELYVSKLK